jgi:hypothetical protein
MRWVFAATAVLMAAAAVFNIVLRRRCALVPLVQDPGSIGHCRN